MALSNPPLTPQTDKELENYLRMRVFLERAKDVLRDVLTRELQKAYPGDFDPSTGILYNVLNIPAVRKKMLQLSRRNLLKASQKQILYPAGSPSSTAKVNDFDVTLTALLLRNITTLNPSAKWDRPLSTDLSTEADIGRVKTYRNNHMHGAARLPAATFQSDFEGLKTVLLRLSKIYTDQDYDQVLINPIQTSGVPTACQLMSMNLPRKDSNFCGREDLLTEIQQDVENSEIVLLTGMGGIGKTSIAVEMGHRMSEKGRDVFFLDMRQVENLDSVQLSLVKHYNPKVFFKEKYGDYQYLFQKALSEINLSTVVIFDSIDHFIRAKKAEQFLQLCQDMLKASKHISLVCTSRQSFDLTPVKVNEKVVSHLDAKSSTWLLSGGGSTSQTEEEAKILEEIAAKCGYCPLALKLLAPQIGKKGGVRMKEKIDRKGILEVTDTSEFERMKSTFQISFEALSDSEKDMFCSLYIFPVSFHLTDVSNILEKEEGECEDILDSLTSKSLVNQVSDQVYDLHPLLNAFSESQAKQLPDKKSKMEISYCKYYSDRAVLLVVIFESTVPKFANEIAEIIHPHLLCSGKLLLKHLSQYLQNKSTNTTALDRDVDTDYEDFILRLLAITNVLRHMYLLNEPLHLLKELANVLKTKQNVPPNRQTRMHLSSVYHSIGTVLFVMGQYNDALKYHQKSLEICKELLETKHTHTARSYSNIGFVLHAMGKYEDALAYQKKGLEIYEKVLDANHPDTADLYSNYGSLLRDMGKYDDALKYHMKSLAIREKVLGKKHSRTAGSYNNIAGVQHDMGKYDEALTYYRKSLEIHEKVLGTDHIATAGLYSNIGTVLHDMGKDDDALKYHMKCLEIHKKVPGTNHPNTADAYTNYGNMLRDMGKYDDALKYYKKSLAIQEELLGTNHTKTAGSYSNIGLVLHNMGKFDDALTYQKKGREIHEKGTSHSFTASSYSNYGNLLRDTGKYNDALKYHMKGVAIQEQLLGTKHPRIADFYNNIGAVLHDMGKNAESLKYMKKALDIYETHFGVKHEKTASCYLIIGNNLVAVRLYRDGVLYLKKCASVQEELLGITHPSTIGTCKMIGTVLILMGQFTEAIKYFEKINWDIVIDGFWPPST